MTGITLACGINHMVTWSDGGRKKYRLQVGTQRKVNVYLESEGRNHTDI